MCSIDGDKGVWEWRGEGGHVVLRQNLRDRRMKDMN